MKKLINSYREMRTLSNARKLLAHLAKHPMAAVIATEEDDQTIREAQAQVADGTEYQPA